MGWQIKYESKAERQFKKLTPQTQTRIERKLQEISNLKNPRSDGKPLKGNFAGYWRYREGDYRILCELNGKELIVLVIDVKDRKDAYKKRPKKRTPF